MEAIYAPPAAEDQPVSNKQRRRQPRKNNHPRSSVLSRTMENVGPAIHGRPSAGSLLFAPHTNPPPSLYFSYPTSLPQQPPLLPLPIPIHNKPRFYSLPNCNNHVDTPFPPTRGPSSSPPKPASATKKTNQSPASKKPAKRAPKLEANAAVSPRAAPFGPDPSNLPKDVPVALSSSSSAPSHVGPRVVREDRVLADNRLSSFFNDELMTISAPPASSLPIPRFCLKPKKKVNMLSCTVEAAAAAIDDWSSDNLHRILRLR